MDVAGGDSGHDGLPLQPQRGGRVPRPRACSVGEANYRRMLAGEDDVLRRVDRVVYVLEWAQGRGGAGPRRDAEAGVHDRPQWDRGDEAPATSATRGPSWGCRADDVVLMSVGTLEPRKNQVALVERLAEWTEPGRAGPDRGDTPRLCKLVLVGEGLDRGEDRTPRRRIGTVVGRSRGAAGAPAPTCRRCWRRRTCTSTRRLAENCPVAVIEAARAGLPWAAVPAAGIVELQRELGGCVPLGEVGRLVGRRRHCGETVGA